MICLSKLNKKNVSFLVILHLIPPFILIIKFKLKKIILNTLLICLSLMQIECP